MKHLLAFAFFTFAVIFPIKAQEGLHIRIRLKEYRYDSVWLGYSFGRHAETAFKAVKMGKDTFDLNFDKPLPEGVYAILFTSVSGTKKQYFNLLIPAGIHALEVEASAVSSIKQPIFEVGSENEWYYAYRQRLDQLRETRNDRNNDWRVLQDEPSLIQLEEADKALADYQTAFIQEHPTSLTAKLASTYRYTLPPPAKGKQTWQQRAEYRQQWFKQHYLDGVDISSETFWQVPEALDWLDQFTFKLSLPGPDAARWYAEDVLRRLEKNPEAFHYYFNYMLNSYESMSRFFFDEMYIYLVRQYVEKGKTIWYTAGEIADKSQRADKMEELLVGKKVPDVTFYTEKEDTVSIYGIVSPYTLLIFFQPDCSHCKKETELVKKLYDKYRDKGLKVAMVCGKPTERLDLCWQFQKDYKFPEGWILLADGKGRTHYRSIFNLQSYPRIYLLDRDKTILFRRSGEATELELDKMLGSQLIK